MTTPPSTPAPPPADPVSSLRQTLEEKQAAGELTAWLTQIGLEWGARILAAIALLIVAWLIASWVRRTIGRALDRPHFDKTFGRFLGNLVRWAILLLGIIACLAVFGVNITSMAALVAAAGLTIGLALQGALANMAAGIMILILRPFKIGDVVLLAGQVGKVDDIDLFNSKIDTIDNRRLIIPNGQIFGSTIENLTHHSWRRCDVTVGTDYKADLARTRESLLRAATSIAPPLDGNDRSSSALPPAVGLANLGPSAIEWSVQVWAPTADLPPTRDRLIEAIKNELDRAGIAIPCPQMEVRMREKTEN